ncbi:hypothetical protein LJC47_00640 [Desulfosarcina sp. OttesenSCG-928-B08]|nr:hypothetical protein [Desulfosarcina sp. OttesenSCG-928-B08]
MDEILKFILDHCSFLYKKFGFKFVDSLLSESFGGDALLVLEAHGMQIQFIRDRSQLIFLLKPKDTKEWCSIDIFRMMLCDVSSNYSGLMQPVAELQID